MSSYDSRKLVGFLNNEQLGGTVLGRVSDLSRIARAEFIDEIIVACVGKSELKRRLIREARRGRLAVSIVPDYLDCESRTLEFDCLGGLPLLTLHEDQRVLALYSKRVVDVVLSSVGLLITAPLIALIALAIKLDCRGRVFYRAPRAGRKGESFACCKFRTMVVNADGWKERLRKNNEREGPTFKIAADPRVTRVGRFLRRYSVDELPQLCNVLRGEMSLVGPRPHTLDDFRRYQLDHLRRLDVTPGDHRIVAGYCAPGSILPAQHGLGCGVHRRLGSLDGPVHFMQDCSCRPERERHIESVQQMPQSATQVGQWTFVTALRPLHALIAAPSFIYLAALTIMLFRPPDLHFYHLDRIAFLALVLTAAVHLLVSEKRLDIVGPVTWPMLGLLLLALFSLLNEIGRAHV